MIVPLRTKYLQMREVDELVERFCASTDLRRRSEIVPLLGFY